MSRRQNRAVAHFRTNIWPCLMVNIAHHTLGFLRKFNTVVQKFAHASSLDDLICFKHMITASMQVSGFFSYMMKSDIQRAHREVGPFLERFLEGWMAIATSQHSPHAVRVCTRLTTMVQTFVVDQTRRLHRSTTKYVQGAKGLNKTKTEETTEFILRTLF
jgi:hypothetical protein